MSGINGRGDGDERANADVQHGGKEQKLIIRALCFFNLTRAELLADDNGNGVAHGEHDDAEEVPYCAGNVRGGDDGQTARGVALADRRGADTPEELVKHERRAVRRTFSRRHRANTGFYISPVQK